MQLNIQTIQCRIRSDTCTFSSPNNIYGTLQKGVMSKQLLITKLTYSTFNHDTIVFLNEIEHLEGVHLVNRSSP